MDLSPNDIRSYEFSNQMRGYDKEEVDSFLNQAATAMEALKQENLKMSMELDSVRTQLAGMREFEDTIKNAAIDARRNADMTVSNAKKEAELILSKANSEAEKAVGSRTDKISNLEHKISQLEGARKSYLSQLRSLINSHMELLEDVSRADIKRELASSNNNDDKDDDDFSLVNENESEDNIEVTDSSEVSRRKMTTIASQPSASQPIITEEVNAASRIVPAAVQTDTDKIQTQQEKAEQDEVEQVDEAREEESKPVDPELAEALENYKNLPQNQSQQDEQSILSKLPPAPAQGEVVETTARAEDIPVGFIATNDESAANSSNQSDQKESDGSGNLDLGNELDNIAAKFAEEMDKAAKN